MILYYMRLRPIDVQTYQTIAYIWTFLYIPDYKPIIPALQRV